MKDDLNDIGSNSSLFLSLFPRFLHIAVAQGRRALSYVLARKMNALHMLDIKEHNGQSAFQVAVAANQHLIVQDLVNLGAQVNTTDCWGRTPLHVCAEKGHSQVFQAIQKGAVRSNQFLDLEATNYDGKQLKLYWPKNRLERGRH